MNKISVWLDLEETLIKSWHDHMLINDFFKVKKYVESLQANKVNIFSYAIWTNEDKYEFENDLKPWLEDHLGFFIEKNPSVADMVNATKQFQGIIYLDHIDFINLVPKWLGFYYYISNLQSNNTTYYLIDDCVPNMVINSNNTIQFVNVKDL
jgi:hypothetical protein